MKKFLLFSIFLLLIIACSKSAEKEITVTETSKVVEEEPTPVITTETKTEVKEEIKEEPKVVETVVEGKISEPVSNNTVATSAAYNSSASSSLTIDISDFNFEPRIATIKKGGTITWTNSDTVKHRIFARDRKSFDSGNMNNGDSYSHTFEKVGTFDYLDVACTGCGWYTIVVEE
ncbi:MAG: hypothetical protein QW331_01485 [Candidatus Woesearchaeota archaeon]